MLAARFVFSRARRTFVSMLLLRVAVTSQDAFAERSLVDLPTVELKLISDSDDWLVRGNTVSQLNKYTHCDLGNKLWVR